MNDPECIQFLQWTLPQLHMQWTGFRRVHKQVCKRLQRRIDQLQLEDLSDYHNYIEKQAEEWSVLDKLCQITISRFYRDKMVFTFLEEQVLPVLLQTITQRKENELRIWCAGSGAGEEPYTFALLWAMQFQSRFPDITMSIVGTEINPEMIKRAQHACYPYSAIKNLPPTWREKAFKKRDDQFCLLPEYQTNVEFRCQDLRKESPSTTEKTLFHLICCRNLAFTYFDRPLQQEILQRLHNRLEPDGILMIGVHEKLLLASPGFRVWCSRLGIYLRTNSD